MAAAECKAGSAEVGEKANMALAPLLRLAAAASPRLITDLNINTENWVTGISQHAAEQKRRAASAVNIEAATAAAVAVTAAAALDICTERNRKWRRRQKAAAERRQRLTENCGVAPRQQQAPERHIHQHLEAGPIEGGRVGEGSQSALHRLGQLHFVRSATEDPT